MSRETAFLKFTGTQAPPKPTSMPDLSTRTPPVVVAAPEPVADPTKISPDLDPAKAKNELESSRIAIFAKKEAAIQKQREEARLAKEEAEKIRAEADAVIKREREFEELWKKDPIQAMKSKGYSDTDIINFMNGTEKKEPTAEEIARRIAQEETQKITEKLEDDRKKAETAEQQRLISSLKSEIVAQIKTKAEEYEYCSFEGKDAEDKVYELVSELLTNNDTGMTVEECLNASLSQAEEFYKARDEERGKLKKRQPKVEEPTVVEPPPQGRVRTQAAPVSNVPQPPPVQAKKPVGIIPPPPAGRRETHSEKRERLVQAILTGGLTR